MSYKVLSPPIEEPISLEEAKMHLRVDNIEEDGLIGALIQAAREVVEQHTGRALITQTIQQHLCHFPAKTGTNPKGGIQLYKNVVFGVNSITYIDTEGNSKALDLTKYMFWKSRIPALLFPNIGECFPKTNGETDNISILYVAGWEGAERVPQTIKQAMLLIIGDWYENRQDSKRTMPNASQRLLEPYRTNVF